MILIEREKSISWRKNCGWFYDYYIPLILVYALAIPQFSSLSSDSYAIPISIESVILSSGKATSAFGAYDGWGMITQEYHFIIFNNNQVNSQSSPCELLRAKYHEKINRNPVIVTYIIFFLTIPVCRKCVHTNSCCNERVCVKEKNQ